MQTHSLRFSASVLAFRHVPQLTGCAILGFFLALTLAWKFVTPPSAFAQTPRPPSIASASTIAHPLQPPLSDASHAAIPNATLTVTSTADSGAGSLRDTLAAASAGDNINFSLPADSVIVLTSGQLVVTQTLTLDGSTATNLAVSGNNASRVFSVTAPLTVISLTIQNGNVSGDGGGINTTSGLTLTNVSLMTNSASNSGGGLYASSTAILTNANFISNTASAQQGGGAFISGAATVNGGLFQLNTALTLTNGYGGGLYANSALNLTGTQFISNTSGRFGGGLYANSTATLNNANFISNTANSVQGGGAFISGTATVNGGLFQRNTALFPTNGNGAGLYANSTINLTGTQFISNTSGRYGGGLYANSTATLNNATFLSNTATSFYGGGAIIVGAATVNSGLFQFNTAPNTTNGFGGGLYAFGTLNLTGTQFLTNTAGYRGGGLNANSAATLNNATFQGNTATNFYGGGAVIVGAVTVNDSLFQLNTAPNTTNGYGGGLYAFDTLNLTGTQFLTNTAGSRGGGFYAGITSSLTNVILISNTATSSNGGGAYFSGATTVNGGIIQRNVAASQGGGLYALSTMSLTGTQFLTNTAGTQGGGLFVGNTVTLTNATLISNTAGSGGGAYFNYPATMNGGTIQLNTAGNGGGVYSQLTLNLTGTQFLTNTAQSGGGLMALGLVTLTNPTFISNTATINRGGGAYLVAATVSGGLFRLNTALDTTNGLGGGMYASNKLNLTGTQFILNTAGRQGGGLYHNSSSAQIVNALFARNFAVLTGTAIALNSTGNVQILHTTIASPTIANGASINVAAGTVNITNTIIASHTIGIQRVSGTVSEWNTLYDSVSTPHSGTVTTSGSITGTAAFVNPSVDNYHLGEASLAINAGTTPNPNVSFDIDDDARPNGAGYDIGYDEVTFTYLITPTAGTNGTITPSTPQNVNVGDSITFTITPNVNYHIADVGVDGVSQGALSSYTFNNVTANHTITSTYAIDTYTLTVTLVGSGSGTITSSPAGINCGGTCNASFDYGTLVTLTVTPSVGSTFIGWGGACSGTGACVVTMDALKNVTALFYIHGLYLPVIMKP